MRSNMQFSAGMVERDYFKERTKIRPIQNEKPDCLGNSYSSRYLFIIELPGISSANVYACNVIVPTIICY